MRSFPRVSAHVSVEFPGVFERAVANCAEVRPHFGVDSPVDIQVFFHAEGFVAKLAPETELGGGAVNESEPNLSE